MQFLNKKALALGLVLGLSASSASATCWETVKNLPCDFYANLKSVFTGKDASDKDASRLTAASKSVLPAAVVGVLGYVVYIKYQEYKKNQANKAVASK